MAERRGATRRRRIPGADASTAPLGWSRRVGLALALVCLGGTIVFAGTGALDSGASPTASIPAPTPPQQTASATATAVAIPAPTIEGSPTILTRQATWQLSILLPEDIPERRRTILLVYRDDRVIARHGVNEDERMSIPDVPLREGDNALSVALEGPSATSARSAVILVTRDDVAPRVQILDPAGSAVVNAASVTVRGTSEPGASLTVRNETSDTEASGVVVGATGAFEAAVALERGSNELSVHAEDAAGNTTTTSVVITRGDGRPTAQLTLSASTIRLGRLPSTISVQVAVLDADGAPVDDAAVTFSLSPPGLPTSTYVTTTSDGTADWIDVPMRAEGAVAGQGLATVQVTLGDGTIVRESAPFRFRR